MCSLRHLLVASPAQTIPAQLKRKKKTYIVSHGARAHKRQYLSIARSDKYPASSCSVFCINLKIVNCRSKVRTQPHRPDLQFCSYTYIYTSSNFLFKASFSFSYFLSIFLYASSPTSTCTSKRPHPPLPYYRTGTFINSSSTFGPQFL